MRLIFAAMIGLAVAGCASQGDKVPKTYDQSNIASQNSGNPYTESYIAKNTPTVDLQPDPSGPKIYRGVSKEDDYSQMLENGFDMLGYSSFEGPDASPSLLNEQAKKVKADLVLVYTELKGSTPASVKLQQMRNKTPQTDAEKELARHGKLLANEQALYSYFASYWVKLAPPLIGVHVNGPAESEGAAGLTVLAVVKQSPAARTGIVGGDVLTSIGEVELSKPEALAQAAQRYQGQTVDIVFQHEGNPYKKSITLNSRK